VIPLIFALAFTSSQTLQCHQALVQYTCASDNVTLRAFVICGGGIAAIFFLDVKPLTMMMTVQDHIFLKKKKKVKSIASAQSVIAADHHQKTSTP